MNLPLQTDEQATNLITEMEGTEKVVCTFLRAKRKIKTIFGKK